jgi:hypothetical protein
VWRDVGDDALGEGGVKLKDVPVGHIFRLLDCECLFRRVDRKRVVVVQHCQTHGNTDAPSTQMIGGHANLLVRYDPLIAMLEEQQ